MKIRINYILSISLMVLTLVGCVQEDGLSLPNGKLQLSLGQISAETETRATPLQIGKPQVNQFKLKIQRIGSEYVAYNDMFKDFIEVKTGDYDVTATFGENAIIGKDTPYYIGTAQATVESDKLTSLTIPCKVGNALVSVKFGTDDTEKHRFDQFFTDYGLLVQVDNFSMTIPHDEVASSIYFRAGSKPKYFFYGTLKDGEGKNVSAPLQNDELPEEFKAAEHAILTLDLDRALAVSISKAEITTVRLDETIPLSWLPVPQATAEHTYDNGTLVGTKLTFSNAYPEMTWEAKVTNASGEIVRTVKGSGELTSLYSASDEWPYLAAGKYKATYFLHTEDGSNKVSSREFMIEKPQIDVTFSGYTSHSLYEEGRITEANTADGFTLYNPGFSVNVSEDLINSGKFGYKMGYAFDGIIVTGNGNQVALGNKVLAPRLNSYELSVDVTFDGTRVQSSKNFRITGVPFLSAPPTTDIWQKNGKVNNEDGYARFGYMSDGTQTLTYKKVAIPGGTRLDFDYKFIPTGDVGNTFTIYAGDQTLVASEKVSGYDKPTYESVDAITLTNDVTFIKCVNSYGAGLSYTDLYHVGLKYQ